MTCVLLRHLGWSRYGIDRATQTFQASQGVRFRYVASVCDPGAFVSIGCISGSWCVI